MQITVIKKDAETKKALEGAVFGLYAKEDIFDADGRLIVAADTFIEKAVTGADGTVTFISDLPLGQYYVKEMEHQYPRKDCRTEEKRSNIAGITDEIL